MKTRCMITTFSRRLKRVVKTRFKRRQNRTIPKGLISQGKEGFVVILRMKVYASVMMK